MIKTLLSIVPLAFAAVVACFTARGEVAPVAMPPGIGMRLSIEGPTFVDARGMTLYTSKTPCGSDRHVTVRSPIENDGDLGFAVTMEIPRSCIEKRPPLIAPPDAQPIGKWSVVARVDGTRQWSYEGHPLYTSVKDKVPGEINGSYPSRVGRGRPLTIASAPLSGVPAGITTRETAVGLALTTHAGKTLYYREALGAQLPECSGDCARSWQPLSAPALAHTSGLDQDWSIVTNQEGLRQWAYNGKALYTYANDAPAHGEQFFGDTFGSAWGHAVNGWHPAVLQAAPGHPPEVTVQTLAGESEVQNFGLPKTVYADSKGMTLYTLHCLLEDGLDCDDVGDGDRYWLSFCGGETRCAKTWHPLLAAASARSIDGIWSVILIDPTHPWRVVVDRAAALSVWAYRGRPVFTYEHDLRPGDYNGDDHGFGTTGTGLMQARTILAYGDARIGAPVLTLTNAR